MRSLVLLLASATLCASAQTPTQNFLLEETTIHTGMGSQFEAAQKQYCAAVVKGGAPACMVFSNATFGQSDRYLILLPFASFIHYDQGKYTDKGMTPAEARDLNARRLPTIVGGHESAIQFEPTLSFIKASDSDKPLNLVTEYRLRPGSLSDFLVKVRTTLLPAAHKSGTAAFEVYRTVVGESTDRVFVVTRLDNFAQLDKLKDPASWSSVLRTYVDHVDTYVVRYRADLSTDPRPPAVK